MRFVDWAIADGSAEAERRCAARESGALVACREIESVKEKERERRWGRVRVGWMQRERAEAELRLEKAHTAVL